MAALLPSTPDDEDDYATVHLPYVQRLTIRRGEWCAHAAFAYNATAIMREYRNRFDDGVFSMHSLKFIDASLRSGDANGEAWQ